MMYGFGIWGVVSSLISAVLGGGMVWIFAMKAQQRKAKAEASNTEAIAEGSELNNVEKAIKIWREMAESLRVELNNSNTRYEEVAKQVEGLRAEVQKLNCTNLRIARLLDKISHENLETTVAKIKDEIKNNSDAQ